MWNEKMAARAKCREIDPDALFVQGAAQNRAKLICRGCPVRTQCLAEALDSRIEFGVWGGMTERERRALLRRRKDVTNWYELLTSAERQYEREQAEQEPPTSPAPTSSPAPDPAPVPVPDPVAAGDPARAVSPVPTRLPAAVAAR
ncbi:WhiB family transcriptional regulator [Nocardiopsis akebiae]|uniref:Transcriptional regulator WhiB n=1 Tax=Nocardiopsis akebiae TaxID=2831968 RepID=A0ABX8C408_9ACTN|nr:WhiB family transcriptional regulator [Nocardiopsis akebiae]QUX29134.1 WhiB family transcriptional regulator [Nocardiopsis akebiae]